MLSQCVAVESRRDHPRAIELAPPINPKHVINNTVLKIFHFIEVRFVWDRSWGGERGEVFLDALKTPWIHEYHY